MGVLLRKRFTFSSRLMEHSRLAFATNFLRVYSGFLDVTSEDERMSYPNFQNSLELPGSAVKKTPQEYFTFTKLKDHFTKQSNQFCL